MADPAQRLQDVLGVLNPEQQRIIQATLEAAEACAEQAEATARALRYVWLLRNRCSAQHMRIAPRWACF